MLTHIFEGCISRLAVGNVEHELVRDATTTEGVTSCETCAGNTCKHNGVCQEAPTSVGYTCLCPAGFSGDDCSKSGQSCYPGKSLKLEDAREENHLCQSELIFV